MRYSKCTTVESGRYIVVKENRSSFRLVNNSGVDVEKIKVDDCLIHGDHMRCDWLLVTRGECEMAYYVELKGCDLKKGVSQLSATLDYTYEKFGGIHRKCFVITTRVPKSGPSVQKLIRSFFKSHSVQLVVKNVQASVVIG